MKKSLFLTLCLVLTAVLGMSLAANAQENTGAIIDYGTSERYEQADLEAAVDVILAEFDTWEGCEMHLLSYAGDEESMDELESVNSMDRGAFDETVIFDSAFRSPKEAYDAWEANMECTWSWTLARAEKGSWELVNFGWKENYLKSEQYSEEELQAGVDTIMAEMEKMEGTAFHYMKYAGDEFSMEQLDYINSLDRGVFDECAVYNVWFQSPKDAYGAWEADLLYSWSFYLGRAEKGEWQIITYGVG